MVGLDLLNQKVSYRKLVMKMVLIPFLATRQGKQDDTVKHSLINDHV